MFFLWFCVSGTVGWALFGARSAKDKRRVRWVSTPLLILTALLLSYVPEPYAFAANMIMFVLVNGIIIALGHDVRKRAMQAVLDGTAEDPKPSSAVSPV